MKNLQDKEKSLLARKIAQQDQLEPLQEKVEQLVMEVNATKTRVENIGLEGGDILRPLVTTQMMEAMTKKGNHDKDQFHHIAEMYEALA